MARKKRKAKGKRPKPAPTAESGRPDSGRRRPARDERPPAPWGRFPLTELSVLAGLILIGVGLITGDPVPLLVGLLVGSLGGLELSLREHFSGFRSHTTLLAAVGAVAAVLVAWFAIRLPFAVSAGVGVAVFAGLFLLFRKAFIRASGGLTYRLR